VEERKDIAMAAAVNQPPLIEPAPPALLSDPLGFFFAEHFRQRRLCNLMEQLANAAALDRDLTSGILAFLQDDMVLHVQDEEEDLFPLMRRRCPPEDEIERVLSALTAEHAGDRHLSGLVVEGLREAMVDFARNERRHLALENSIVLPLARLRLTEDDLAMLSACMTRRHGDGAANLKA
jgi:hemerythrin-like domain-containing protein